MSSLRLAPLRHLSLRSPLTTTRRWARVHDVRFLATTPRQHLILDKYRSKLDEKAKTEGHATLEDLKLAYADKIAAERRRDAEAPPVPPGVQSPPGGQIDPSKPAGAPDIPQAPETPVKQPNADRQPNTDLPTPPPSPNSDGEPRIPQAPETPVKQPNADSATAASPESPPPGSTSAGVKSLDQIMKLEKCRHLPEKEITALWRLRHASHPNTLCAAVPAATYRAMEQAARKAPQFVLPIPHPDQGAEMHFLQWTFDSETKTSTVLFTQLAEYKMRGEFAQPHTTVTHHLDLMDEASGVALMQGQVVDGRGVDPEQAKWLVLCLQRFYGGWDGGEGELEGERKVRAEERRRLLEWFARGDEQFSVEKLLDEAQRMG